MNVSVAPGFAAFRLAYEAGRGSLVWRKTVADLDTPVAAFLKLAHGQPNSFLLESVEGGAARGRYSVIGMQPLKMFEDAKDYSSQPFERGVLVKPLAVGLFA